MNLYLLRHYTDKAPPGAFLILLRLLVKKRLHMTLWTRGRAWNKISMAEPDSINRFQKRRSGKAPENPIF